MAVHLSHTITDEDGRGRCSLKPGGHVVEIISRPSGSAC